RDHSVLESLFSSQMNRRNRNAGCHQAALAGSEFGPAYSVEQLALIRLPLVPEADSGDTPDSSIQNSSAPPIMLLLRSLADKQLSVKHLGYNNGRTQVLRENLSKLSEV